MPTDMSLEDRLQTLYAIPVPRELDRRIVAAMAALPVARPGRTRPRMLLALAVAAIVATMAAAPALQWFEDWHRPFDRLWEIATPVDQTVTADGYRVTVHRAYADRLGIRLATTVEDLEGRWSELMIENADVVDARGRVYEAWNWSHNHPPVNDSAASWSRFILPVDFRGDDQKLRVTFTSLVVRAPEPLPPGLDPERVWTSVTGSWTFQIEMPSLQEGQSVAPFASATSQDVTIALEELAVVPSGIVVRLAIEGLPKLRPGMMEGWYPVTAVEHDGERHTDDVLPPGILGSDGSTTFEVVPVVEDLAGHWKITVIGFHSFDPVRKYIGEVHGTWVLEFDVAETP